MRQAGRRNLETMVPKRDLAQIPQTNATGYPPPFDSAVAGRPYRRLTPVRVTAGDHGDVGGRCLRYPGGPGLRRADGWWRFGAGERARHPGAGRGRCDGGSRCVRRLRAPNAKAVHGPLVCCFPANAGIQGRAKQQLTALATPGLPPPRGNTYGLAEVSPLPEWRPRGRCDGGSRCGRRSGGPGSGRARPS